MTVSHDSRAQQPRTRRHAHTRPLAFWILGTALIVAASPSAPQRTRFEEQTLVFEVRVPIHVVDREGRPIRDLTAADFRVYDERVSQEITGFQVIDLDTLDAGETRTEIDQALEPAARRHFLLLFDLTFSSPPALIKARRAARRFVLEALHPTDLVAVATHAVEDGTRLLVTFTPDRAQVARAIDTLGAPRLLALGRQDPLRFILEDPAAAGRMAARDTTASSGDGMEVQLQQSLSAHLRIIGEQMERVEKSFARGRVSSWSESMADLAHLLDSVRGRKQIVYFSEGFDGRLLLGRQPDALDPEQEQDQLSLQRGQYWMVDTDDIYGHSPLVNDLHRMLEEFRRADCVIQAVDISGLGADLPADHRAKRVGQDALFYVANETGGELFEDANDFGRQLEQVLERSSVTYLLTFRPSRLEPDGSYHRLKVEGDVPRGAHVVHRPGYYAPRPFQQLHPVERNLLAADRIASATPLDQLDMSVLAAPFRAREGQAYVPVILEIGGKSLLAGQEDDDLRVELYAYATDDRGQMRDFFTYQVGLDLAQSRHAFERTGLKYYGHLELTPGDHLIRVLARNAKTGATGVRAIDLRVPALDGREPVVLPPFFPEPRGRWYLVREETEGGDARSVVYPFTVGGEIYVPAAEPSVARHGEARFYITAYNLDEAEIELTAAVYDAEGEPAADGQITLEKRTVTGIEGLDKLVATFQPNGLPAGRYTLEVAVRDRAGRSLARPATMPVTVVN